MSEGETEVISQAGMTRAVPRRDRATEAPPTIAGRTVGARTEQVLGQPPRLAAPGPEALGEHGEALIERIRTLVDYPRDVPVHPFFTTLALTPDFFEAFMGIGLTVMGSSTIPARERELVIMRTGWLLGAPYQFGEHVYNARAMGFTGDDIERVKLGSAADGWERHDRALVKAAEELRADAMISDETWAVLAERLTPGQLVELPMIVGHYTLTAFVQNSLRIRCNDHNPGLESA